MLAAIAVHLKLRSIYYDMIRSYQARQEKKKQNADKCGLNFGGLLDPRKYFPARVGVLLVPPTRKCGSVVAVAFFCVFLCCTPVGELESHGTFTHVAICFPCVYRVAKNAYILHHAGTHLPPCAVTHGRVLPHVGLLSNGVVMCSPAAVSWRMSNRPVVRVYATTQPCASRPKLMTRFFPIHALCCRGCCCCQSRLMLFDGAAAAATVNTIPTTMPTLTPHNPEDLALC